MNEKQLTKVTIIASILGLLLLYLYTGEIELKPITTLENTDFDETVTVQGKIYKLSQQDTIAFLDIENEKIELTKVVLFKDEDIWLKVGDYVEITGTVEEYNGEQEIIGNKIEVFGR